MIEILCKIININDKTQKKNFKKKVDQQLVLIKKA